jgi:ubiquinone/menaquinone biosynthesis C-methylase UbiE
MRKRSHGLGLGTGRSYVHKEVAMNPRTSSDSRSPAEIYDEQFVPALFRPWAAVVADTARIGPGLQVLDVACGTGVLACEAAGRVGEAGAVTGLDANPEMLAVARRKPQRVTWVEGRAEALPFGDASFDAVVSQFGFMFFDDRAGALREMRRVLRPGGRLSVAVCDAVDRSPGYAVLAELLQRLFGTAVADAFRAPFALGDAAVLRTLCDEAGLAGAEVSSVSGPVRFASIDALVSTERACAWTLGGLLDDAQFDRLREESQAALRPFARADGTVEFDMPALIIAARR